MQRRPNDSGLPVELRLRTLEQLLATGSASLKDTLSGTCRILAEALAAEMVQIYHADDRANALLPVATVSSLVTEAAELARFHRVSMRARARIVSVFATGQPAIMALG